MSVISLRGKKLTGQLTSLSLCLMAVSTCTGILFGTTVLHRKASTPTVQVPPEPQLDDLSPVELPPAETGSSPATCDTAKEDQAVQAVSFSMPDADNSIGMGWGCRSEAEYRRAIESLTKAIHEKPNSSNAYCKRAWVYFSSGQFRKAIKDAGKSIQFNPKNEDAYQVRSYAYGSLGQDRKMSQDQATYMKLANDPH